MGSNSDRRDVDKARYDTWHELPNVLDGVGDTPLWLDECNSHQEKCCSLINAAIEAAYHKGYQRGLLDGFSEAIEKAKQAVKGINKSGPIRAKAVKAAADAIDRIEAR